MGIDASRALDLSGVIGNSPPGAQRNPGNPGSAASDGLSPITVPGLVFRSDDASFGSVLELSSHVPVVICFVVNAEQDAPSLTGLVHAVEERDGRIVLVTVDAHANPKLAESFRVDEAVLSAGGATPVIGAVIAGRSLQLFAGTQPADVLATLFDELILVGEQNGVTGRVDVAGNSGGTESDALAPDSTDAQERYPAEDSALPAAHQNAFEAIERGDLAAASEAYRQALVENPKDEMARAGLAQVSLLNRLNSITLASVRETAASNPENVAAALDVADADIAGGHVDDAFDRLLTIFRNVDQSDRDLIRLRLLDYFAIVGDVDPRVVSARARLASLLY